MLPRIFRPPAPVEVKKAGRFAFVQTLPLRYNQGRPLPMVAYMHTFVPDEFLWWLKESGVL
jgi:hypothetical protein